MSAQMQSHVPPHSAEAEQAAIGAMLLSPMAIDDVASVVTADQFYYPEHKSIYSTIVRLHAANKAVDVVTVDQAGAHGMQYLNDMAQSCPTPSGGVRYAEIVAECWRERELIRVGTEIADDARRRADLTVPAAERVDRAVASLMGIVQGDAKNEPESIESAAVTFLDRLNDRYEGKDDVVSTGLVDLDELTAGGGRPGELWVLGARPSMGKTALTLTVCLNVAARDPALFCSQEDSKDSATSRFVASIGRVSLSHLRKPQGAPESMWGKVSDAVERLRQLDLYIDDQGSLTLLDVRRKIQQVKRRLAPTGKRLRLVVVDYLQLMVGEGASRNLEMGRVANGLKATAKEFGVWIILLSQLSRKADERSGPPQMSDLRDSGDIEGAADLIGLLYREAMRNATEENKHFAVISVAKQKNGPTGTVNLYFDGAYQQFSNWSGPVPKTGIKRGAATYSGGMD